MASSFSVDSACFAECTFYNASGQVSSLVSVIITRLYRYYIETESRLMSI